MKTNSIQLTRNVSLRTNYSIVSKFKKVLLKTVSFKVSFSVPFKVKMGAALALGAASGFYPILLLPAILICIYAKKGGPK
jgi:hypothetical protein